MRTPSAGVELVCLSWSTQTRTTREWLAEYRALSLVRQKISTGQYIQNSLNGLLRVIVIASYNDIRLLRCFVLGLQSWNITRLTLTCAPVYAFGITLDAYFQRTINEDFDESWNPAACVVSIGPAIAGGIDDD